MIVKCKNKIRGKRTKPMKLWSKMSHLVKEIAQVNNLKILKYLSISTKLHSNLNPKNYSS